MSTVMFKSNRNYGYEVSSSGDKRFSALFAKMADGRTIEEHYQCDIKGYPSWRAGKGKPPLRDVDLHTEYVNLWKTWAKDNMDLIEELASLARGFDGYLSDRFARTSNNQATALAQILNELGYSV